jgi:hypothetical protein
MQRMVSLPVPSSSASAARSGYTPWLWVQTVYWPLTSWATAHEGPIEACSWNGFE